MKSQINTLREQRTALAKDTRNLLDNHPGKKWGAEQQTAYDAKVEDINRIDAEITRLQKQADIDADNALDTMIADANKRALKFEATSPRGIYDTWLRQGDEGLTAEQRQVIKNTMSTTTGAEGGFTVPTLVGSQLYDSMKAYGAMRAVAEVITTSTGVPLSYPTSDGTAEIGEIIAQNAPATAQDPTFGTASLNVFKFGSKVIAVPFELLQDSTIDMEAFVRNRMAARLGRIGNLKFTVGAGGGVEPDGIVPRASAGKVGIVGETLTAIYDDVVDLVHSVDPAYRATGCAFMASDTVLRSLRKIKDTGGRPIWTPSYEAGIRTGLNVTSTPGAGDGGQGTGDGGGGYTSQTQPVIFDYLLGYPLWVNNDLAVPAANAKSMLFGNFSYYKIRDAMEVQMFRFTDSFYTKLGQVGFLAWCRMGGNLMDPKAVVYFQNSAT